MQSVSSRIWTRVAVSISYDDNHYSTGTSKITNNSLYAIKPTNERVWTSIMLLRYSSEWNSREGHETSYSLPSRLWMQNTPTASLQGGTNHPCPVDWGCKIHRLLLYRGVRPPANECPRYDTKQSDGEVPAMLELWGMQRTPSLPALPDPLWPGVVAPDRALSMG